ncbi:hypothetical protein FHR31_001413 [Parvibacter caecicola]|uniref:Uncharacterized protein n=1 Tax=Parvibacter caecicola TaxID=747645 RepID=A0A7W5D2B3_9ACTN|nr:hypothetical protein [Parvibacter caecicola]
MGLRRTSTLIRVSQQGTEPSTQTTFIRLSHD